MVSSPRWRPAKLALAAVLTTVLAAACGAVATHAPSHASTSVTVRGPLVRVRSTTLLVRRSDGRGTVRVTFAPLATPIYSVTPATNAAIQPGSCVATAGDRDANGTLTARAIVVAASVDDACPANAVPAPPSPADPGPSPSPSPGSFPLPSPSPGPDLVRGQVMGQGGAAIVVQGPQGEPEVVLLQHDLQVWLFQPSYRSALVVPSCVVVQGTRHPRSVAARRIVDWPSGTEC